MSIKEALRIAMIRQKVVQLIGTSRILHRILAQEAWNAVRRVGGDNNFSRKITIGGPLISLAILGFKKNSSDTTTVTAREVLLAKADALFEQGEYQKIYDMLHNYRDNNDVEILWRLSRALYNMAKDMPDAEAKKMIYEGYDTIVKALQVKEDNYAVHKWMAVLLDKKSSCEGKKARIRELYNVKNHLLRAVELNPTDATTIYMLGNWCYQVSDLAWYQKKIVEAIFGSIPDSSFEEALQFLERAEHLEPNFYSHNLLLLGKTCLKLSRKEDALMYLKKASEFKAKNDEDLLNKKEATKLLGSI